VSIIYIDFTAANIFVIAKSCEIFPVLLNQRRWDICAYCYLF